MHLRPGLTRGVRLAPVRGPGRRRGRPAGPAASPGGPAVRAQRHEPGAWQVPGAWRRARGASCVRGVRRSHRAVRRRDRVDLGGRPADRGARRAARRRGDLPQHPLRHVRRATRRRDRSHRDRAAAAARPVRARGQAARGATAAHAHRVRPGDAPGDGLLQRHRELLRAARRSWSGRAPAHAAGLLPRRLPDHHRRVPRHHPPAPRAVRGGPVPQVDAGRARLPAAVRRRQPSAAVRGVGASAPGRRSSSPPRPVRGSWSTAPRWSSRSCGPPA